ncbi:MAG TPA: hypothetical protein VG841_04815 [Caulobacterales bacterium]|nr:hypothetical protein [Caulobacterales bacterium]
MVGDALMQARWRRREMNVVAVEARLSANFTVDVGAGALILEPPLRPQSVWRTRDDLASLQNNAPVAHAEERDFERIQVSRFIAESHR